MNEIDEATRLTVELAKSLIREMQALGTAWHKAFLRAEICDEEETCKGSFVLDDGVHLLDVSGTSPFLPWCGNLFLSSVTRFFQSWLRRFSAQPPA